MQSGEDLGWWELWILCGTEFGVWEVNSWLWNRSLWPCSNPSLLSPSLSGNQSIPWALLPGFLPSQGCSCSAPVRIHILGPEGKSCLSTQSFPKSPCPGPVWLCGWDLIKSPFTMRKWEIKMGIKSALLLLLQWLSPVVPCKETLVGCISHFGS